MRVEGGMNMGRKRFGLIALVLVFAVLTVGSAVAAEEPQTTSDGLECKAEERLADIYKVGNQLHRRGEQSNPAQWAEQERRYREISVCLKPALLAGRLVDPKDDRHFADAMRARISLLRSKLDRKDEADVLHDELLALSDAGLLKDPLVQIRINQVSRALKSGDLTLTRELAEAMIARARAVDITLKLIRQKQETHTWTPKLRPDGRVDDVWRGHFSNASFALKKLDEIEKMFQTRVCGKVTLAQGKSGPVTATVFDGHLHTSSSNKMMFVRVGVDGNYCLPVRGTPFPNAEITAYMFFTAPGYLPQARVARTVLGKRHDLADIALAPRADPDQGGIIGAVVEVYSGKVSVLGKAFSDTKLTVEGPNGKTQVTTDEQGIFYLDITPESYRVYDRLFSANVTVVAGETVIQPLTFLGGIFD